MKRHRKVLALCLSVTMLFQLGIFNVTAADSTKDAGSQTKEYTVQTEKSENISNSVQNNKNIKQENADIGNESEHTPVLKNGMKPDCYSTGYKDYYKCGKCGKMFEDEACTKEITDFEAWKNGEGKLDKAHTNLSGWMHNKTKHYKQCWKCLEKTDEGEHEWQKDETTGLERCAVCGYQPATELQVKIGKTVVINNLSENSNVNLAEVEGLTDASGNIEWDLNTRTLTLDGISLTNAIYIQKKDIGIENLIPVNIKLKGTNTITSDWGIQTQTDTEISAEKDGTLTVDASQSAIAAHAGSSEYLPLTISGGEITLKNIGEITADTLTVKGDAKLNIEQKNPDDFAILVQKNFVAAENAIISINDGYIGIYADEINISGNAKVSSVNNKLYGIYSSKTTVSGDAELSAVNSDVAGIFTNNMIAEGGMIHAEGKAYGLLAKKELTLSEGYGEKNSARIETLYDGKKNPYKSFVLRDAEDANSIKDAIKDVTVCKVYPLIVNLDGGDGLSANGKYGEGVAISINAGTKSGYRFKGWTSEGGGTFEDESSEETVFTMPQNAVTITAGWRRKRSGGVIVPEKPVEKDKNEVTVSGDNNEPVELPVEPLEADGNRKIKVNTDNRKPANINIPVKNIKSGDVVAIVNPDGTEKIIRDTKYAENALNVTVPDGTVIRIVHNSKSFDDTVNHWAEESIEFVTSRELYKGVSDDEFAPDLGMSRGMLAQVLYNLEGNPEVDAKGGFNDVLKDAWYSDAVLWAADKGVVSGYTDGTFGPDDSITREQLAVMLYRYSGASMNGTDSLKFNDADEVSDYAENAMNWAVENGIISGMDSNTLSPKSNATRAQVAVMLMRFMNK